MIKLILRGRRNSLSIRWHLYNFIRIRALGNGKKSTRFQINRDKKSFFKDSKNQRFKKGNDDFCKTLHDIWANEGLENIMSSAKVLRKAMMKIGSKSEVNNKKISGFTYPMH